MRINVKLFAILRERAGVSEVVLDLPQGSTVSDAASRLAQQVPSIAGFVNRAAFAVNRTYSKANDPLAESDELAIIPPVSGGRD